MKSKLATALARIQELEQGKYWICDECAEKQNLTTKYPTGGNTVSITDCDWCDAKAIQVTPIVDFKEISKGWD